MAAVPAAYSQLSQTLLSAARGRRPLARLQVEEVAKQCADWAKPGDSFYVGSAARLPCAEHAPRGENGCWRGGLDDEYR
jgi:hypothetical protein